MAKEFSAHSAKDVQERMGVNFNMPPRPMMQTAAVLAERYGRNVGQAVAAAQADFNAEMQHFNEAVKMHENNLKMFAKQYEPITTQAGGTTTRPGAGPGETVTGQSLQPDVIHGTAGSPFLVKKKDGSGYDTILTPSPKLPHDPAANEAIRKTIESNFESSWAGPIYQAATKIMADRSEKNAGVASVVSSFLNGSAKMSLESLGSLVLTDPATKEKFQKDSAEKARILIGMGRTTSAVPSPITSVPESGVMIPTPQRVASVAPGATWTRLVDGTYGWVDAKARTIQNQDGTIRTK
jgi:hypothetical protein